MENRPFNKKIATNSFSFSGGQEKNQYGRSIANFMYDCDFYHFSDFSKTIAGINPLLEVPNYCYKRGDPHLTNIFLWGDSHAQMLYYGLYKNLNSSESLHQVARAACKPAITPTSDPICSKTNQFAIREIGLTLPGIVIVAQRDYWSPSEAQEIHDALEKMGIKKVFFVGKSPEWKANLPKIILRKYWLNTPKRSFADLELGSLDADRNAKAFINKLPNSYFIDLHDLFCNQDGCLTYLGDDPKAGLTSFDGNHLSPIASDFAVKELILPLIYH